MGFATMKAAVKLSALLIFFIALPVVKADSIVYSSLEEVINNTPLIGIFRIETHEDQTYFKKVKLLKGHINKKRLRVCISNHLDQKLTKKFELFLIFANKTSNDQNCDYRIHASRQYLFPLERGSSSESKYLALVHRESLLDELAESYELFVEKEDIYIGLEYESIREVLKHKTETN